MHAQAAAGETTAAAAGGLLASPSAAPRPSVASVMAVRLVKMPFFRSLRGSAWLRASRLTPAQVPKRCLGMPPASQDHITQSRFGMNAKTMCIFHSVQ